MIQMGKIFAERYKIVGDIGRGGMANVYRGEDTFLGDRPVAIKVLRSNFENDAIAIARFQREAYSMSEISHPNIVSISDVGEYENQQYIVMEFVDGLTLKQYIKEHAPLSNEEAVSITTQILAGMQAAHSKGIIHRDLKPQNVLIVADGTVKITDFGIAKALTEASLTQTNTMFGSVHYLSPEQARGADATVQSDIYAIGIILFELLTGQIPFDGDSAVAIALKHFQENLPSIININKNVPQALENVSIKATAKDVRYRYADINEMLRDIGTALSLDRRGEQKVIFDKDKNITQVMQKQLIDPHDTKNLIKPVFTDEAEPKNETNQPKKKKRRGLIATLIILGLLLVGFLAYLIVSPSNVKMPNVTGMTLTQAEAKIKDAHLKVGKIDYEQNSTVATNNVISTDPQQNSTTKEGTSINIVVSQGANPIKMPDYVGQMYKDAVDDLIVNQNVSNNQITKKDVQSSQPAGTILNQTPGKGQYFDLNGSAQIVFEVSTGPADSQVTMPTYTSGTNSIMKLADLKNQLINLGVPESNITVIYQQTQVQQADGYVANVNPQQGTQFDPRTTQIVISVYQYQASESSPAANTNNSSTSSSPASTTPPSSS